MPKHFRYFLVYKPYRVLCQFTDPVGGKRTLGDLFDFPRDVYPVGRLDEDSEGLLLLTNDPASNQALLGKDTEKEYWVQVEGTPTAEALEALRRGVEIRVRKKTHRTLPAEVKALADLPALPDRDPPVRFRKAIPTTWLSIKIREGKNRQVRKMTAKVGFPTLRLVRVSFGPWKLKKMQPGDVVEIKNGLHRKS